MELIVAVKSQSPISLSFSNILSVCGLAGQSLGVAGRQAEILFGHFLPLEPPPPPFNCGTQTGDKTEQLLSNETPTCDT